MSIVVIAFNSVCHSKYQVRTPQRNDLQKKLTESVATRDAVKEIILLPATANNGRFSELK